MRTSRMRPGHLALLVVMALILIALFSLYRG
jgi:hypothetical protein